MGVLRRKHIRSAQQFPVVHRPRSSSSEEFLEEICCRVELSLGSGELHSLASEPFLHFQPFITLLRPRRGGIHADPGDHHSLPVLDVPQGSISQETACARVLSPDVGNYNRIAAGHFRSI